MSVTKADLADILCDKLAFSKQDAKDLVDNFFAEISEALVQGEEVKISGFGNFLLNDKKPRPGRNPKTGKAAIISGRRVVTFKQGHKLKGIIGTVAIDPSKIESEVEK
jgi:integration host factor subunit alpha